MILSFPLRFFGPLFFPLSLVFFSFLFFSFHIFGFPPSRKRSKHGVLGFWRVLDLFFLFFLFPSSFPVFSILVHGTITFTVTAAPFSSSSSASNYCYLNEGMQRQRQFLDFSLSVPLSQVFCSCHGEFSISSVWTKDAGDSSSNFSHIAEETDRNGIKDIENKAQRIRNGTPSCYCLRVISSSEIKETALSSSDA